MDLAFSNDMSEVGFNEAGIRSLRQKLQRENNASTFGAKSDQDLATVQTLAQMPSTERASGARALGAYDERYTEQSQTAIFAAQEHNKFTGKGDTKKLIGNVAGAIGFGFCASAGLVPALIGGAAWYGVSKVANWMAKSDYENADNIARVRMAHPDSQYGALGGDQTKSEFNTRVELGSKISAKDAKGYIENISNPTRPVETNAFGFRAQTLDS